ncbi:RNA-guided endonuclease InsQ/TnpB family protein [Hungatella hathewayi]|uniref:Transposase n=1 Tax=Hungatella hathewayi TaxID=154046 RepID=A0A174C379_9FIRM|nr:RNA-guided endonuclease TnpB family protein [Hungatella hathewayi]CUO07981.1 transposase [Hungatella hathewayi]
MKSITITAKVKLYPTSEQMIILNKTLSVIRDVLNFVSTFVFGQEGIRYLELDHALYYPVRQQFGLRSQMTQSVFKTVLAKYKSMKSNGHPFSKVSFRNFEYDLVWNRDYSISDQSVSLNTLSGRLHIPFEPKGMEHWLHAGGRFGTARLIRKNRKYYLHIPVTLEVESMNILNHIVGIDLGINHLAVSFDDEGNTRFFSGRAVKEKRAKALALRKRLQACGTKSAKRKLKKLREKETRYVTAVNHAVTKALISQYGAGTLFIIEDLTGIRTATEQVRLKSRYVMVSWAFYQFREMLEYKAALSKSEVLAADPKYTSQSCPVCGNTTKANRSRKRHEFCCTACGYRSNDDRTGAINIYRKGYNTLFPEAC